MTAKKTATYRTSVNAITTALLDRLGGPMQLPKHLRQPARIQPFVDDLLSARARHEWLDHELALVVQAARLLHDLTHERLAPRDQIEMRRSLLSLLRTLRIAGARLTPRPTIPQVEGDDDLLAR